MRAQRLRLAIGLVVIVIASVVGGTLGAMSRPRDGSELAVGPLGSDVPGGAPPGDAATDAASSGDPTPRGSAPTREPDAGSPGASPLVSAATESPQGTPKPTPRRTFATPPPRAASSYLLVTPTELRGLPTSGAAWSWVVEVAGRSATPKLSSQDSEADIVVLAKALVFARTGDTDMRGSVVDALHAVVGTEKGGRTLALGRNLPGFLIGADLIDLRSADPTFDSEVFRPWLRTLYTKVLDGQTLVGTAENRPNNWGTHAGAARVALARYLGDSSQLARQAKVFHGWLGDRASYAGFKWGSLSWQCDPAKPTGINPPGCTRDGHSLDGVLPDDQRRGGDYTWPPPNENYAWEALQGASLEAELLYQAGYPAWSWEDAALLRAVRWLIEVNDYPAAGDDRWQPWLVDARYGTSFRGAVAKNMGKNFAFTEWIYRP